MTDPSEEGSKPGRIAIGTQRPGVAPPSLAPRYRYVGPAASAPADAALPPLEPAEGAATDVDRSPPAASGPPPAPPTSVPTASVPVPAASLPPAQPGAAQRPARGGRGRDAARKTPFEAPRTGPRVPVPNRRAGLDDELEADFAAAVEGLAIDELLDSPAALRAEVPLDPGARITGVVLAVGADTAFIDLGGRRQGAMKLAGFLQRDLEIPAVGQTIDVSVGRRNQEDGLYDVAPANRAVAVEDWSHLEAGLVVEARVTAANKGGLECDVAGLRGFMPASLVSPWRVENLEEMVGQTLESLVTEIVPAARRLVLSRRAVIEKQASEARTKMLETLEPGTELDGIVRSVRDFGAFVDIGNGVEGLVHVSELSWDRVASPADVLQTGQRLRVVVKKVDRQTGKIGLSARDLVESPWKRAAEKYHVGATVRGTVSRIAQFGAFVRLEPGIEGLVHVSEVATRRIRSVADVLKEGEPVDCRVLSIDPEGQKLALSIKALAPPPAAGWAGGEATGAKTRNDADAEVASDAEQPASRKPRKTPLKGGLSSSSDGARFGLTW